MKKTAPTENPASRRAPLRRSQPKRDWKDARAKVERERVCRNCGTPHNLEAAHTAGREFDRPKPCPLCRGKGDLSRETESVFAVEFGPTIAWCPFCDGWGSLSRHVLWVDPDDIVPLCGPATDSGTCHGKDHAHQLDLLPLLSLAEQLRVVGHLDGIENARVRTAPSQYRTER